MSKKISYQILFFTFLFAFLAAFFDFSQIFNIPKFPKKEFKLGLDLQGGVHLVYQADLSGIKEQERAEVMNGLRDVIERRVNLFGVREPVVQIQGEKLVVELSGEVEPSEAIKEIGKTPFLEFREEKENFEEIVKEKKEDPFKPTPLTGRYLKRAEVGFDQTTFEPLVSLEFNEEGAKIFEELTERNVGKILAIYIDGIPISTPVVREKISGGRAQITGKFTISEAKELARNLNAGALPAPIKLISQKSIGPILGKISLEKSFEAGIYGFLSILLFLSIFYRFPGFLASFALLIYVIFNLALYKLIPVTLTLAGIAGFLLSMGMAVDANILIFSRMREEEKKGKDFLTSLEEGLKRAWPSIRDGNFSTILVGLILFIFGTSFVQGFALTLVIGNLIGMFTAILITQSLLILFEKQLEKYRWLWQ
jgi:preprotein translocase subunit SecD